MAAESTRGERPWGLFSLDARAMYGILAGLARSWWRASLVVPVVGVHQPPGRRGSGSRSPRASAAALAGALVAMNELDAILNPCFLAPILAASGGLIGLKIHADASAAWLRRAQSGRG